MKQADEVATYKKAPKKGLFLIRIAAEYCLQYVVGSGGRI
jgi:hypothetical protein